MPKPKAVYHGGYNPHQPLPIFADNSAAIAGGLDYNEMYSTAAGAVNVVVTTTTTTTTTV